MGRSFSLEWRAVPGRGVDRLGVRAVGVGSRWVRPRTGSWVGLARLTVECERGSRDPLSGRVVFGCYQATAAASGAGMAVHVPLRPVHTVPDLGTPDAGVVVVVLVGIIEAIRLCPEASTPSEETLA